MYCRYCEDEQGEALELEQVELVEDSWDYGTDSHYTSSTLAWECPKCSYRVDRGDLDE